MSGSFVAIIYHLPILLQANLHRVLKTLPDVSKSTVVITLVYALSQYSKDEVCLVERNAYT